jgi:hypothetical protein
LLSSDLKRPVHAWIFFWKKGFQTFVIEYARNYFQILHYSGVHLNPKTDGEINYLTAEDLPHMINPIERKLGKIIHQFLSIVFTDKSTYTQPIAAKTSQKNLHTKPSYNGLQTFVFRLLCFVESKFKLYRFCATKKADAIKNKRY